MGRARPGEPIRSRTLTITLRPAWSQFNITIYHSILTTHKWSQEEQGKPISRER
jgi:hypothetical protein